MEIYHIARCYRRRRHNLYTKGDKEVLVAVCQVQTRPAQRYPLPRGHRLGRPHAP